jgi:hypothetical protein
MISLGRCDTQNPPAGDERCEQPRGRRATERRQEFSSFDVACRVTLQLGVIHAMEGSYHGSIARSGTRLEFR